jgi:SNF2 family DNA or RNA helicase
MTPCRFRNALGGALLSLSERQIHDLLALARKSNDNDDLLRGCWIVINKASPERLRLTSLGGHCRRFRDIADFCIYQAKDNSIFPFKVFVELVTLKAPQTVAFTLFLNVRRGGCKLTDMSDQIDDDCDVDEATDQLIIPRQFTDIETDEDDHLPGPHAALEDDTSIEPDHVWAMDDNRNVVLRASVLNSTQLSDLQEVTSEGLWRGFQLPPEVFRKLYPHQKDFMIWMANIHARGDGSGGLCADHMGLGKTPQTLVFLGGLMRAGTIRNAAVIVPAGLIPNWIDEARKWLTKCVDNVAIVEVSSAVHDVQKRRCLILQALDATKPHLMVTSQDLVGKNPAAFKASKLHWDYVVVDEGQKVKNLRTRKSKGCEKICSYTTHRLMLSGTPLQNRPEEFWCILSWLFKNHGPRDFPRKRSLFNSKYGKFMEKGRNKNASALSVDEARAANEEFQYMIKPFFLKRQNDLLCLPKKQEFVVFIEMNKALRRLYSQTLERDIAELLQQTPETNKKDAWALPMLNKLQSACLHPCLVDSSQTSKKKHPRLTIMWQLIEQFKNEGHQTLIFSQSTRYVQYHSDNEVS